MLVGVANAALNNSAFRHSASSENAHQTSFYVQSLCFHFKFGRSAYLYLRDFHWLDYPFFDGSVVQFTISIDHCFYYYRRAKEHLQLEKARQGPH